MAGVGRAVATLVLLLLGGVLLWRLKLFVAAAGAAIADPRELDYGEGIVWQQMRMMFDGRGYGPIDGFPSIVFHYPPVYHGVVWLVSRLGGLDELAWGRAVSAVSTLTAALMVGLIGARQVSDAGRWTRLVCGAIVGVAALSCWPVLYWGALMRVDMIASALTLSGFYLAMRAVERPRLIYLAAIAFVAAVFAKQTMIAAPAAAFGALLLLRPRVALVGLATSVSLGLVLLITLGIATDGGFLRHIFLYNINRFDFSQLWLNGALIWIQVVYLLSALAGFCICALSVARKTGVASGISGMWARLKNNDRSVEDVMILSYATFATGMLVLGAKVGSSSNYFIEWLMVSCALVARAEKPAVELAFNACQLKFGQTLLALIVPISLIVQAMALPQTTPASRALSARGRAEVAALAKLIRDADRPIISDNMVLLIQNGKEVVWEPAIFAELAHTGFYDEHLIVQKIRRQDFAFIVTTGRRGSGIFDIRYNPAVSDAIGTAYPREVLLAHLIVHFPRD